MPFTPFHMGAALLLKPVARERFSVLVFGVSQVLIDIEPLVRIIRGDTILHGFTHTLCGALAIGAAAAVIARVPVNAWLEWFRPRQASGVLSSPVSWSVAFFSAWIGTGTHLAFDAMMHADMHPFAPLTANNPLLGRVSLGSLHWGLMLAGVLGLALLALREMVAARTRV